MFEGRLGNLIQDALEGYPKAVAHFRSVVNGDPQKRTDSTEFSYSDPLEAVRRYSDDLAGATARYEVAVRIKQYVDGPNEAVATLEQATVAFIEEWNERRRYMRTGHSDLLSKGLEQTRFEATEKFVSDLAQQLVYMADREQDKVEKDAEFMTQWISASTDGDLDRAQQGVALVLTDPVLRAGLDPKALEQLSLVFGATPAYVREQTEAADSEAAKIRQAEAARQTAERQARKAIECEFQNAPQGRMVSSHKCDKAGRYLVTYQDGTVKKTCGTHLKSKCAYLYGRGGVSVGEIQPSAWSPQVVRVVDSTSDVTLFDREEVGAATK